ncbi:MAG: 3-dehydroquinate synthase [Verrucomicrobia bacterium]|nr:MAG: 3-dehydroquinate synthase [Verrucomicrobiota bacterium]
MEPVQHLNVELGDRSYPIAFGADLSAELTEAVRRELAGGRRLAVVTDERVRAAQAALFEAAFAGVPVLAVPGGETSKCLSQLEAVCDFLAAERVDRRGLVLAVGGGVVGDLAGFAAASYLRGVDFWQVPTTLLAMVDSAVGGKTGVNLKAGKNLVGAFHQPRAVWCSMRVLETLPEREFAAGMAEVIKTGLLGDARLFETVAEEAVSGPRDPRLPAIVRRCCEIKAAVVKADERETAASGGRALLNLGHTFAHAIEAVAGYGEYLHGEAVGVGLVAAARLSAALGLIGEGAVQQVETVVAAHALPVALRAPLPLEALMAAMQRDKKVRDGRLRFVVMEKLGQAATREDVDAELVRAIWRRLGAAAG